ncbi:ArsC/Spx/MgsR family protein [Aerococcus sp. UMB7834]|uniref:ArsC/Spx/MgsR family protein n=1 Tax=Aerococcus sp. UMB7834 TaxID=3046342 RepID=UPI002550FBFB|nr:ArsC/Spx/MgsR family protein [Aerococcus sp. UMB7834]MDK6804337.1 ArsC/Spx/MgsR family protein [Aerococcus sp. UMB7834]
MNALDLYGLKKCSTCQKVSKQLEAAGYDINWIDIRQTPPQAELIRAAVDQVWPDVKKLFNSSGQAYRQSGLKDKIPDMSKEDIVTTLAKDGMLIKRPFLTDGDHVSAGSREQALAQWLDQ